MTHDLAPSRRTPLRIVSLVLAAALAVSGCSIRTTGSPRGDLTLIGEFDDVQHLVVGHGVRMADVTIGTVTNVKLDGYTAVVEFSIADGRDIPEGTIATISATSLLGENYVRLVRPDDVTSSTGIYEKGETVPTGPADASFEELTVQLLTLLRAIQGRDVATVVNAGVDAIGDRGADLGRLFETLDLVGDGLTGQSAQLVEVLDSFVAFGEEVADNAELVADAIVRTADATGALAAQSDRIIQTFIDIQDVATALDTEVLIPHRQALDRILTRLAPIVSTLTDDRDTVIAGLAQFRLANTRIPRFIENGEAISYGLFQRFNLPGGLPPIDLANGAQAILDLLSPTGL